jgi:RND family efflux transporter MFP subunit
MRTDRMRVEIQVPDLDVPLLDVGDQVTFEVDALKGRKFAGLVARLGKSEDPATRTMKAEVDLENADRKLVEGMYGRAKIELQPRAENLTIPAGCVVGHAERGQAALFVFRDGKVRRNPVTLGGDDGVSVEVLSGVGPDDRVVVRPGGTLEDGAAVHAKLVAPKDVTQR